MTLKSATQTTAHESAGHSLIVTPSQWQLIPLVVFNETVKSLLIQWSYRFNLLMESIMLIFLFLGITFFVGNGELEPSRLPPSLLGFVVTFYAMLAISTMAYNLQQEAQQGTLEQWYMSPAPTSVVQFGRTLATFIVTTVTLLPVIIPLMWGLQIDLPWRWAALPIFLMILVGVYGFGFLVGGAVLLFKQIGPLANMVQNLLLFLNGSFVPLERFPDWLAAVAYTLPTSQGIVLLRRIVLDDESLFVLWQDGSLRWLSLHSGLYLLIGLLVFGYAERVAKRRGLLGQY